MLPISFEFFPPKTDEQREQLDKTATLLKARKPEYVSCTFGAGGSTLTYTPETIKRLRDAHGFEAAPHLSCMGGTRAEIRALLAQYKAMGCRRLVALRGDLPSGMAAFGEFRYASELVEFIRSENDGTFRIEVACYPEYHPQARNPQQDLLAFKAKVDAGADGAITQYFYNADAYFHFVEQVEAMGVQVPVVPGIMPINNFSQLARFSDACGAEIPRGMRLKLEGFADDTASIKAFGLDVVTELCDRLISGGAPGLHFYTMNMAGPTSTIWHRLGL